MKSIIIILVNIIFLILITACDSKTDSPAPEKTYPDLTQQKLLTDDELITPDLDYSLFADENYQNGVANNHHKIRSLVYDQDFSDLYFLEPLLTGKRIVQLGENTHGSAEFNHLKIRMIKYMHEQLGFNVIAFESSLLACHMEEKVIQNLTPINAMYGCIYGVWHTQELIELFRYIQQTKMTQHPLILTSFDTQLSSWRDTPEEYLNFLKPLVANIDSQTLISTEQAIESFFKLDVAYDACGLSNQTQCQYFLDNYAANIQLLLQLHTRLEEYILITTLSDAELIDFNMASIGFKSLTRIIAQMYELSGFAASGFGFNIPERDDGMAENITAIAEKVYPGEKIIIWAHNAHISNAAYFGSFHAMGEALKLHWKEQLYTIGFFMIRGKSNGNKADPIAVLRHYNSSLEALAYSLRTAAIFLPFSLINMPTLDDDWQFIPFLTKYWGVDDFETILSERFDAVIVIDRSTRSARM